MATTPEGKVKEGIKKVLRDNNIWYYMPVSNGMGTMGIPDFVCCWHGRFLGIEAKAPGKHNNVSPRQLVIGNQITSHGGEWIVISDPKDLQAWIDAQGDDLRSAVWRAVHPSQQPGAQP